MKLSRPLYLAALVAGAVALGACGDDDTETVTVSAGGGKSTVVPATTKVPRYAGDPSATQQPTVESAAELDQLPRQRGGTVAPKVRGSDVPMAQFLDTYSNDVAQYWQQVFNNSKLQWPQTTQAVVTSPVNSACGQITPETPPRLCPGDATIYLPVAYFENTVKPIGDGAVAGLVSLVWGNRVMQALGAEEAVKSGKIQAIDFHLGAICMAGANISYVGRRELLEEGDPQEILNLARATGGPQGERGTPEQRVAAFRTGFSRGPGECLKLRAG
jgi:predicted metalloprotease